MEECLETYCTHGGPTHGRPTHGRPYTLGTYTRGTLHTGDLHAGDLTRGGPYTRRAYTRGTYTRENCTRGTYTRGTLHTGDLQTGNLKRKPFQTNDISEVQQRRLLTLTRWRRITSRTATYIWTDTLPTILTRWGTHRCKRSASSLIQTANLITLKSGVKN